MRVALITACYGAYDPVRSLPADHGFDDAVCVTDTVSGIGEGWRVYVEPSSESSRLAAVVGIMVALVQAVPVL